MPKHTIMVKKHNDVRIEKTAADPILPGMILQINADDTVSPWSHDFKPPVLLVAIEDDNWGKDMSYEYKVGTRVQCWFPGKGDIFYAVVKDGAVLHHGDGVKAYNTVGGGQAVNGLPAGGTDGQVLTKDGSDPYKTRWETIAVLTQALYDALTNTTYPANGSNPFVTTKEFQEVTGWEGL